MLGVNDRQVDLVQEGVDCVIRTGDLNSSTLVARPLGRFRWVTCASPDYLRKFGIPRSPDDLSQHRAIHYFSDQTRRADALRFVRGTETVSIPVRGEAAVNATGLYINMCLEGFGWRSWLRVLSQRICGREGWLRFWLTGNRLRCPSRCFIPISVFSLPQCVPLQTGLPGLSRTPARHRQAAGLIRNQIAYIAGRKTRVIMVPPSVPPISV